MKKPANWDETPPAYSGDSLSKPPIGAYIATIVKAEEGESKNGNKMLIVSFDIAEGEYKDYFHTDYKEQLSRGWEGQWRCLLWLPTEGKGLGFLKGLVTMVEESNAGYKFAPLFDEKTLKGKKVGLVLNQCEYMSGDQVRKSYFVKRAYRVSDIRQGKHDAPVWVDVDGREHKQNEPPTPSIELEHVDEVDIPF